MKNMVQGKKVTVDSIKKMQNEGKVEMKNSGSQTGTSEASLMNRIQEMDESISGTEDKIEETDTLVKKKNVKYKSSQALNIHEIWDTIKKKKKRPDQ